MFRDGGHSPGCEGDCLHKSNISHCNQYENGVEDCLWLNLYILRSQRKSLAITLILWQLGKTAVIEFNWVV